MEKQPGLAVGLLQGAVNTRVGKGSGPESAKAHAALEKPAFWIQHNPEKAVGDALWLAGGLRHTPQRDPWGICQPGLS